MMTRRIHTETHPRQVGDGSQQTAQHKAGKQDQAEKRTSHYDIPGERSTKHN